MIIAKQHNSVISMEKNKHLRLQQKKRTWLNDNRSSLVENESEIINPLIILPGKILRSTCIGGWTVQKHRHFPPLTVMHSRRIAF